jgi:predicted transport protein
MELFKIENNKIETVELKPFKLERDIQNLVEGNTLELFQLEFVRSEFTVGKYRIDTLCYDPETNAFVIIEYKKGNSYSVIDQGYTYLQLLLNNKSDFILTLSQEKNKIYRTEDMDWSQSRIIFISPSFNSYQKDSVNFKNIPFELYEIKRFENDTFILNKHETSSKENIDSLSNAKTSSVISEVSKEVKVFDEEHHTSKLEGAFKDKWEQLREQLLELDDIELDPKKTYINVKVNNKTVAFLNFRKSSISIEIQRGNLNTDGTTSKNFFNFDDPKNLAEERSWEWKSGVKGNVYVIKFDLKTDIDYTMFLLKQKYKSLNKNS